MSENRLGFRSVRILTCLAACLAFAGGRSVAERISLDFIPMCNTERKTTEIGKFETIQDVRDGKCKEMKPRDKRKNGDDAEEASTDGSGFTDVSSEVSVPW